MYTIAKQWDFDAAHQLNGLPPDHKCSRLHGHTYRVELQLEAKTLDSKGMVRDYGDLAPFGMWIKETLDHRYLNDIISQPTTELVARFCYEKARDLWPEVISVKVWESSSTWAEYR